MKTIIIDGIEYNLTPKVLFKKGDFVVIQETTYLISKIEGLNVTLSCNGRECLFDIDVLKNARLWDITKDAKDGDVLHSPEHKLLWIYKNKEEYHAAINLNYANFVSFGADIVIPSDVHPATKEQRDLLFQKMREAGYEWNQEAKELKKLTQSVTKTSDKGWSEDDEFVVKELGSILYNAYGISDDERETCTNWLKSIEGRVQPKPMEVWSGKDEDKFNKVIDELTPVGECPDNPDWEQREYYHGRDVMIEWLKSLRTRLKASEHDNVTSKTTNVGNSSITVEGMYNPTKDASV